MRTSGQMDQTSGMEGKRERLMGTTTQDRDSLGAATLTVVLIGPDEMRRNAVVAALVGSQARIAMELSAYPSLDDVPRLLESHFDVVIIELDSEPEHALDLIEAICSVNPITVMVYSARSEPSMLVRCMRAGAREFLSLPISPGATIEEAMVRAMVRRPTIRPATSKAIGKLMVFIGAKGGSGVTTIATNFAVAISQESKNNALLIDLDLPIGDAALSLGIRSEFSVVNALENFGRLDSNFLSKLLTKHSSGLSVLSTPDVYVPIQVTAEAINRVVTVARQTFDFVVIDAGSNITPAIQSLFKDASAVYLITQVSIPELRNSNRLISEFFEPSGFKPEVVLNRFTQRPLGIDEREIGKALTQQPQWKVPSDYETAQLAQNTATALALKDSSISRVIRQMARTACGLPKNPAKKKGFGLFG
jgi:pilus assembly protein CpaE